MFSSIRPLSFVSFFQSTRGATNDHMTLRGESGGLMVSMSIARLPEALNSPVLFYTPGGGELRQSGVLPSPPPLTEVESGKILVCG